MRLIVFVQKFGIHRFGLFKIINAAITPGTQPKTVKIETMMIDPHPLSNTANGGKIIDKITRPKPINY